MFCEDVFVALASEQLSQTTAFYQGLFDQAPAPYLVDCYAEFRLPGLRLAIFSPAQSHHQEFSAPTSGAMSLCLEVPQLEAAMARLSALGYPPRGAIITASHGREIYAYDPDGNRLILHERKGRQSD